jgi:hypothetical protein
MSDDLPSYGDIEKYVHDLPKAIIDKLPDCIASRRAKQLLPTIYEYTKEARDLARRGEPLPTETPSEASMRRAQESGIA